MDECCDRVVKGEAATAAAEEDCRRVGAVGMGSGVVISNECNPHTEGRGGAADGVHGSACVLLICCGVLRHIDTSFE